MSVNNDFNLSKLSFNGFSNIFPSIRGGGVVQRLTSGELFFSQDSRTSPSQITQNVISISSEENNEKDIVPMSEEYPLGPKYTCKYRILKTLFDHLFANRSDTLPSEVLERLIKDTSKPTSSKEKRYAGTIYSSDLLSLIEHQKDNTVLQQHARQIEECKKTINEQIEKEKSLLIKAKKINVVTLSSIQKLLANLKDPLPDDCKEYFEHKVLTFGASKVPIDVEQLAILMIHQKRDPSLKRIISKMNRIVQENVERNFKEYTTSNTHDSMESESLNTTPKPCKRKERNTNELSNDCRIIKKKRKKHNHKELDSSLTNENIVQTLGESFRFPFSVSDGNQVLHIIQKNAQTSKARLATPTKKQLHQIEKYVKDVNINGIPSYLTLHKVNEIVGWGVFLKPDAEALEEGTVLGIYAGKYELVAHNDKSYNFDYSFTLLDTISLTTKQKQLSVSDSSLCEQCDEYSAKVNASKIGNFLRYVNHSKKPNVVTQLFMLENGNIEVVYLVGKDGIKPGEECLIDYEGPYWKKKGFIPLSVQPGSYRLGRTGEIIFDPSKSDFYNTKEALDHLTTFRRPLAKDDDKVLKEGHETDQIPSHDDDLPEDLDTFKDHIFERGISSPFALMNIPETKEWGVFLKPDQQPLPKGSFVGVYGGTFATDVKTKGIFVQSRGTIVIDAEKKGNFTREINFSLSNSNVKLIARKINDVCQLIFVTSKQIEPGEQLLSNTSRKRIDGVKALKADTFMLHPAGVVISMKKE